MRQEYLDRFREDLNEFYDMTAKFYRKEITVPEYKSFSGGFGSYAQRGGERSMLRLRLACGEINRENLKFIKDSIEKYSIDLVHLTTCQTVQVHNLTEKTACALVAEAFEHGIITRGGGGDFPRNVMCSPLSGVREGEYFDVVPYAREAADYLLSFIGKVKLPRKLKVCFQNSEENEVHATFRDMGFVATPNHTFDVYIAGGLGIKPMFGVQVVKDLEPSKILYAVKSMVDVFTEYGNYEKRSASRSRFLQETLTPEGLKKVFEDKLETNLADENLDITVSEDDERLTAKSLKASRETDGTTDEMWQKLLAGGRVIPQKQEGLYAAAYHPAGGKPKPSFFGALYDLIEEMDEVKIRLTPDQGMYVINLTRQEAMKVLELTADDKGTVFEHSTACIGADICQVGIGKSQVLLQACLDRVKKESFADGVLPAVHISGCPSSCAAHQTAILGFRGGMKQTPEGPKPAFAVYENGCDLEGKERFGKELGVMLESDIPEFLVDLGKAVVEKNMTYPEFQEKYPDETAKVAGKYL